VYGVSAPSTSATGTAGIKKEITNYREEEREY